MTKREQRLFFSDLVETLRDEFNASLRLGKIPKEWDGIELRWLLRDKACELAAAADRHHGATEREKDYMNTMKITTI